MLCKVFSGAILAAFLGVSIVSAQSIAQLGGPANLPPASFKGQQFVDSRGCLFLRAGFGNQVNWVPRVNRTHSAMCGLPPSFGPGVAAAVTADMAPQAPAPQVRTAMAAPSPPPGPTVFARPAAPAQPAVQVATPQRPAQFVPSPGPQPTLLSAPKPTAPAAPAPRQPGKGFFATLFGTPGPQPQPQPTSQPLVVYIPAAPLVTGPPPPIVVARTAIPTPPPGYKMAWKDDRLNPQRGQGTAAGQAAQNMVWSQTTPMVLVAVTPQAQAPVQTSVSTMSAPQSQPAPTRSAATGAAYIQIGSFGQPGNATTAAARLAALGLPSASTQITRNGTALQVVYAGPFATTAAAQRALPTVRGAGFADAFVR